MREYLAKDIRNIAIVGHNTVGKTTLVEAMALFTGKITRMGSVDDGTTLSDYAPEEIEKKYSIRSSLITLEYADTKLNLIDCPGYADFVGETYGAIRVADTVLITLSAAGSQGVDVGTENGMEIAQKYHKPIAFFINKCDNENADFEAVLEELRKNYSNAITALQYPVGKGDKFTGIVDLLTMKMYVVEGGKRVPKDIPADLLDRCTKAKATLMEDVAGTDEALMDKYLDTGELTADEFQEGFKKAFDAGLINPVFCGSALKGIGVTTLMEDCVKLFVPPSEHKDVINRNGEMVEVELDDSKPFSSFVFKNISESHIGDMLFFKVITGKLHVADEIRNGDKTEKTGQLYFVSGKTKVETNIVHTGDIAAVVKLKYTKINDSLTDKSLDYHYDPIVYPSALIWEAIKTKDKNDDARIGQALVALSNEDPTFSYKFDAELQQTIIYGQGVKHLEIMLKKLHDRNKIGVDLQEPRVAYRETITAAVEGSYRHKKQSGGKGQFGEVHIKLRPRQRGEGFNFIDAITGGSIPARFVPAVEKGITETLIEGVISGSKVIDVEAELFFGKFHDVDSSEMAFKIASRQCFKELFRKAKPIILEPINELKVIAPNEYAGDVMGDISSKRGRPEGMEAKGTKQVIVAKVPQSELYRYATTLRSMTQGKASFETSFSHYELVPPDVQMAIVKKWEASRGHEEEEE